MRAATILQFLLESTIIASVAILLMLPLRRFLRGKLGNRVLYFAWLLVALRLLLPIALPNPAINEIVPAVSTTSGIRPIAAQIRTRFDDATYDLGDSLRNVAPTVSAALHTVSTETDYGHSARWFLLAYFVIAAGFAAYATINNVRFRRKLKERRIEALSGERLALYHRLCKLRGVKPIPVYWVDPLPSACLVGLVRPYIALPLSVTDQDIEQALSHELCHHKIHDEWWNLLRLLCCVVHWFNPLVWLAARLSQTDCELACDDRVTRIYDDQKRLSYANALAVTAARKNAPGLTVLATGMTMKGKHLKQRISAIVRNEHVLRWLSITFAALACVALVFAFGTKETTPQNRLGAYDAMNVLPPSVDGIAAFTHVDYSETATEYASAFLTSDLIGAELSDGKWSVSFSDDNFGHWAVSYFPLGSAFNYGMGFDEDGLIWFFHNSNVEYDGASPSFNALTNGDAQAASYGESLRGFANARLPGIGSAIGDIRLISDTTNSAGERFLTYHTSNARCNDAHEFVLQIAPVTRLVQYTVLVGADQKQLAVNTTGDPTALTRELTAADVNLLMRDQLSMIGFEEAMLSGGSLDAVFDAAEGVWVATFNLPTELVPEAWKTPMSVLQPAEDNSVYTVSRVFDRYGNDLMYTSLDVYKRRNDPVITPEQAMQIGTDAAVRALNVSEASLKGAVGFNMQNATFHYSTPLPTNDNGLLYVSIDAHTGEIIYAAQSDSTNPTTDAEIDLAPTDAGASISEDSTLTANDLAARDSALSNLTEVYGWHYEDAVKLTFEIDTTLTPWRVTCYPAEHPSWMYEFTFSYSEGMIRNVDAYTPFQSLDHKVPENDSRTFVYAMLENGWFTQWGAADREAYLAELDHGLYSELKLTDEQRASIASDATPVQAVQYAFEAAFGRPESWEPPVTGWMDEVLARLGYTRELSFGEFFQALKQERGDWPYWSVAQRATFSRQLEHLREIYPPTDADAALLAMLSEHTHGNPTDADLTIDAAYEAARQALIADGETEAQVTHYSEVAYYYTDDPDAPVWEIVCYADSVWMDRVQLDARSGQTLAVTRRALAELTPEEQSIASDYVLETPPADALTLEQADAIARKALVDRLGLSQALVDGLRSVAPVYTTLSYEFYSDGYEGTTITSPHWQLNYSLNDPRTDYDYSVFLDAHSGEVYVVLDPSNVGNG